MLNMDAILSCVYMVFTSNQPIVLSTLANCSRYARTAQSNIQLLVVNAKIQWTHNKIVTDFCINLENACNIYNRFYCFIRKPLNHI